MGERLIYRLGPLVKEGALFLSGLHIQWVRNGRHVRLNAEVAVALSSLTYFRPASIRHGLSFGVVSCRTCMGR